MNCKICGRAKELEICKKCYFDTSSRHIQEIFKRAPLDKFNQRIEDIAFKLDELIEIFNRVYVKNQVDKIRMKAF